MRSSSTEPRRRGDAGAWLRLTLVGVLGAAALAAPVAVIGRTGALYTDSATVTFTVVPSAPAPTPTPSPTTTTSAATSTVAGSVSVAAPVTSPAATPSPTPTPTPTPAPTPTASQTSQPATTGVTAPQLRTRSWTWWPSRHDR